MARISEVVGYWPFHPILVHSLVLVAPILPTVALTSAGSTDPPHGALTPTTSLMPGSCQVGPTTPTRRRKVILSTGNNQITRHATHQTVQKHENQRRNTSVKTFVHRILHSTNYSVGYTQSQAKNYSQKIAEKMPHPQINEWGCVLWGFWPCLGNDLAFLIAWFLSPAAQASFCTDVLCNVYSQ